MADKKLESITFPDLPDRYVVKPDIADVTGLQTALDGKASKTDVYNSFATDTAQGSIASFTDGADGIPLKSLTVDIVPVQSGSGDPSPDNVRAISGFSSVEVTRAGKNLFGGVYATKYDLFIPANQTFTVSAVPTGLIFFEVYDIDGNVIDYWSVSNASGTRVYRTFTLAYNVYGVRFGNATNATDIQLELGSTATAYESYHGTTVTIPLGNTYYGGVLDVVSGVLTVDWMQATLDGTQAIFASNFNTGGYVQYDTRAFGAGKQDGQIISNCYLQDLTKTTYINLYFDSYARIIIRDARFGDTITNATQWNTWLSSTNVSAVYELATPQTVQLTPSEVKTLLGNNNIWADTGDVDLTYRADLSLYLHKILNA